MPEGAWRRKVKWGEPIAPFFSSEHRLKDTGRTDLRALLVATLGLSISESGIA